MYSKLMAIALITYGWLDSACILAQSSQLSPVKADSDSVTLVEIKSQFPAMGTLVELTAYVEDPAVAKLAFDEAEVQILALAAILTDYDSESEARRVTAQPLEQWIPVSLPLWEVLAAADQWHELSHGGLDCSLGQVTLLWRKYRRAGRLPSPEDVRQAMSQTGWSGISLDRQRQAIQLHRENLRLDFGAIGKGYIVDQAFQVLHTAGLKACLVNISGNMRAGAAPPGKSGWSIAVAGLEKNGAPLGRLSIVDTAVATSGDLWQYTVIDGVKRSHIIDPQTGYGVVGPLAVTVLAPTALAADALATIGCIQSWPKYQTLVESQDQTAALRLSTSEGKLEMMATSGFPQLKTLE